MTNTNATESAPILGSAGVPYDVAAEIAKVNALALEDYAYEEEGWRRTYRRVAAILAFVEKVHRNPIYKTAWDAERVARQITIPGDGVNPFAQYVKALSGRWDHTTQVDFDGEKRTKWEPDRSSEKLAKVVRWLYENGVKSVGAADFIDKYVNPDNPKETRMFGIEQADKRAHPAPARQSNLKAAEQKDLQSAEGLFELPSNIEDHVKFHDDFAVVILRKRNGRVDILTDAGFTHDQVIRAVKQQKSAITAKKTIEVVLSGDLLERYRARVVEKPMAAATA